MNWVENQDYWIERTKSLEDKLSDRLHDELTKSFIDKRASVLARGLKQDMTFNTEITENDKVMIDKQFIGNIKGLKLELDLKIGTLDTDIKSLRKVARQGIGPEFSKRIKQIIDTGLLEIKEDFKIYWTNFPIARFLPGKDYLEPELSLIVDDIIEVSEQKKLKSFLDMWIKGKINFILKNLIDLKNLKEKNTSIRALAYQLYENNGVLKREIISDYLKKLSQDERKILRNMGVKFGRYHVFLFKLLKPEAVSLRILLWKNYHQKFFNLKAPTFGLNFIESKKFQDKSFMLLCGFESFENSFVRIDILERLFVKIINSSSDGKGDIKLIPDMLNLLGCSKENFLKLIKKMNYKSFEKNNETYFKYIPKKQINKKFTRKYEKKDNPFDVLKKISFK
jgi:ATP-dependent RNA helicase SUPV3L1/SUV3